MIRMCDSFEKERRAYWIVFGVLLIGFMVAHHCAPRIAHASMLPTQTWGWAAPDAAGDLRCDEYGVWVASNPQGPFERIHQTTRWSTDGTQCEVDALTRPGKRYMIIVPLDKDGNPASPCNHGRQQGDRL